MVGIMAMDTETVHFFPVPFAGSLAVDAGFPVTEDRSVALAAEIVGFLKGDKVAVGQPQYIPVVRIMAVKAPALLAGMVE